MRQFSRHRHVQFCRVGAAKKEPYMTDIYLPSYMVLFLLFYEPGLRSNRSGLFMKLLRIVIN